MSRLNYEIRIGKSLEFDEDGNAICCGEASNENADLEGDITLQQAMIDSKDYFLASGVVTYDHRHNNPDEKNPEHYIIGEPIDVEFTPDKKTRVKFKLFRSNAIAQEIIGKLKDKAKTVRISIGGRFGRKQGNKIVSFLWDEIALTYKPVNNTLSPVYLGNTLSFSKSLKVFNSLLQMHESGMGINEIHKLIRSQNMAKKEEDDVLTILDNVNKSLSDEQMTDVPDEPEGDLDLEEPLENSEDDEEEGVDDTLGSPLDDEDGSIEKSVSKELYNRLAVVEKSLAALTKRVNRHDAENKATANTLVGVAKSLKRPMARQGVINKSITNKETKPQMTKEEVIQKSLQAVKDRKISIYEFAEIESGIQKGIPVSADILKKLD